MGTWGKSMETAEESGGAPRVLVVEGQGAAREVVRHALGEAGFRLRFAAAGEEALRCFQTESLDLIVTDHHLPRVDGIELVRRIRAESDVPVVILTACGSIPDCERAMRAGADRFLQTRRDAERLARVARELVESRGSRRNAASTPELTAEQARALGQRELQNRLKRLVVECRGNIAEIARRMNRDRSTIRYHLRRMGLLESAARSVPPRRETGRTISG